MLFLLSRRNEAEADSHIQVRIGFPVFILPKR